MMKMSQDPSRNGVREPYLDYLGLTSAPFPVSPDAEHFFFTAGIESVVSELLHGLLTRKGFLVLTGEVGLGKTTICRRLLQSLEEQGGVDTSLVIHTLCQGKELLDAINADFGIRELGVDLRGGLDALNRFLLERNAAGRNCVILIDDAQNLDAESLELVRMISNLETGAEKLVQILLVGQPELITRLEQEALRQLRSRIAIHAQVRDFDLAETRQYLFFRLNSAGHTGRLVIPEASVRLLHRLSRGNPRRIHLLMDRALYGVRAVHTSWP